MSKARSRWNHPVATPLTLVALATVTLLALVTCNNLTMIEEMSSARLDEVDPIVVRWAEGYPKVAYTDATSMTLQFSLDQSGTIYFGVWPEDQPADDESSNFHRDLRDRTQTYVNNPDAFPDSDTPEGRAHSFGSAVYDMNDATGSVVAEVTNLAQDTSYTVYAIAEDIDGNLQPLRGLKTLENRTTSYRPAWKTDYPRQDESATTSTTLTVRFAMEESATIYWGVWPGDTIDTDSPDYDEFNGKLRLWIDDAPQSGTYSDSAVDLGKTIYNVNDEYVEQEIDGDLDGGLEVGASYQLFAVGVTSAGELAPMAGVKAIDLAFPIVWANVGDADHLTLHISEPAILNGETARFVVRAENADNTVNTDVNGKVEIDSGAINEITFDEPQYVELTNGMGYADITLNSNISGGVQTASPFTVTVEGTQVDGVTDGLDIVDTTGFTAITTNAAPVGTTAPHVIPRNTTIVNMSTLEVGAAADPSILVIEPGVELQMLAASGFSLFSDGKIYVLGTQDDPVHISGAAGSYFTGFVFTGSNSETNLFVNGTTISGVYEGIAHDQLVTASNSDFGTISIANSRINDRNVVNPQTAYDDSLFYIYDAAATKTGTLFEVANTVFWQSTTVPPVFCFAGGFASLPVNIENNTFAMQLDPGTPVAMYVDLREYQTSTATITENIVDDAYSALASLAQYSDNVEVYRNVSENPPAFIGYEPAVLVDNINENVNALWETADYGNEDFRLSDTGPLPSGGVPDFLIGSLTAGHPNEVGAYANFGYPPGP